MADNDFSDFTPDTSDFTPDADFTPTPRTQPPPPNMSGMPLLGSGYAPSVGASLYGLKEAGKGIYDVGKGFAQQIVTPPQSKAEKYLTMIPGGVHMKRMLESAIPSGIGQLPGAIKDLSESSDPLGFLAAAAPRALGQGAGQALLAAGTAKAFSSSPLDAETAANRLTNAVNPPAKNLQAFEQNLTKHFDKVTQYARDNNITINSRESLAKAMQGAADTQRTHYYNNILGPVRGEQVLMSDVPGYSGGGTGASASLGDIDARLSQINAELRPKYNKGGMNASAAVKSEAELNAEASALRSKLYTELANRTGLTPQQVAETRGSFGALGDLSEKTGLAAAKARTAENTLQQGPVTINPLSQTKHFLLDKAINAMRGDTAGKAISKTITQSATSPFTPPQPIFGEKVTVYRPPPITQVGGTAVPSIFDRPEPTGFQGSPVRGPKPQPGAGRVPLWKKMLAESLSGEEK